MTRFTGWVLGVVAATALSSPAFAVSFFFNGTQGGVPGNGTADFTINSNNIVMTLTNTGGAGQVSDIASELDGIDFTLTGGSAVLNAASLSGSDPNGAVTCAGVVVCTSVATPASPFGWSLGSGPTFLLAAGSGSFKPDAIVNGNIVGQGGNGNTSNAQHNPLLLGPVAFTIGFTGTAPTGIGAVDFFFGTSGTALPGTQTPEPAYYSLVLLGIGAIVVAFRRRKLAAAE